ncbi:MAG: hypothetical protein HY216_15930 [Candidatus Rokubacteria bacterium]|nr:hypothetical protein [Candidatus Rokubacteria bacterium]
MAMLLTLMPFAGIIAPAAAVSAVIGNGVVESTSGGFKFPDGTIQDTAAPFCGYVVDSTRASHTSSGRITVKSVTFTKALASTRLLVRAVMSGWSTLDGPPLAGVNVAGTNYDQSQISYSSTTSTRAAYAVFNVISGLPAGDTTLNFYIGRSDALSYTLMFNPNSADCESCFGNATYSTFEVCEIK